MRVLTLIENHNNEQRKDLRSEHGLSFYIENRGHMYMSDVGQSVKFAQNAKDLGIDLKGVEKLAISHHHYDHGGGLKRFFKENDKAVVYLRHSPKDVDYIGVLSKGLWKHIGLDKKVLAAYDDRILYITGNQEISPGFHLLTDIPDAFPKPSGDKRLMMKRGKEKLPDTFEHELITVFEGEQGLVVLTGCAHNGVLNMIAATHKALPDKHIRAVVGGFHLNREDEKVVREVGEQLLKMDIPAFYTGHCTGDEAVDVLEDVLGERLHRLYTGLEMVF